MGKGLADHLVGEVVFLNVVTKIKVHLNQVRILRFVGVIEFHITIQLPTVANNLFPALSECYLHVSRFCSSDVRPKCHLVIARFLACGMLGTNWTTTVILDVLFSKCARKIFAALSKN